METRVLIGDVHGCLDELDELMRMVGPGVGVIGVGDLMDRGPDSLGVVRRFRENGWHSVMGNHDEKAVRWRRHEAIFRQTGKENPMRRIPEERRKEWESLSEDDVNWLRQMPLHLDPVRDWLVVHAGFEPGVSLDHQKPDKVVRVRYVDPVTGTMVPYKDGTLEQPPNTVYWTERWNGPGNVVYGHAVHSKESPRIDFSERGWTCFGIDTGCCFGGRLTGMLLKDDETHEFVQVQAKREYFKMPGYGLLS